MHYLVCTIGFAGKTAQDFFALLEEAGVEQLIDIRQHRSGQLSGYAKHPDLAFFLQKISRISYVHEPLLAPTQELLDTYRNSKDWPAYEIGFLALMKDRRVSGALDTAAWPAKLVLLCSESGPEKCHRRLVADLLAARWRSEGHAVEIRHLISSRAKPGKPRQKKRRAAP